MVGAPWYIVHGVKPGGPGKDMGSYQTVTFSPEQQEQFGINEDGQVQDQAKFDAGIAALKALPMAVAEAAPAVAPAPLPKLDVADAETLKGLKDPIVIDARDQNEIDGQKGGPAIEGSKNVPVNMDGVKQSEHPTTTEEYHKKLLDAAVLPDDKEAHIITHCGNGGRGGRAAAVLRELGYPNAHNGGSPDNIRKVVKRTVDPSFEPDEDDMERQMNLELHPHAYVWLGIRKFFNVVFLIELLVNAYGSWLRPFWREPWNLFDCVIVSLGCLDLFGVQLGQWKLLRMLRAFRVFRLFGRVESLAKVLGSLSYAMPGVINSFLVVMIVMCIYSVLAVDLFGRLYCNEEDKDFPVARTSRDVCFGRDYYGDFPAAFYTMFQILTGESWSEAGVRPIIAYYRFYHLDTDTVVIRLCVQLFFYSYILLNSMVLINVVIAVLLDGMSTHLQELEREENEKQEADPVQKKPETDLAALAREVRLLTERVESMSPSRGEKVESMSPSQGRGDTGSASQLDSPRGLSARADRTSIF